MPAAVGVHSVEREEAAFRELVEPHRAELHAHCYRMLGSLHDADDALQETLIRAWRAYGDFRGDSSPRTWLHRIATNVCLNVLRGRPKRILPMDYGPPSEAGQHASRPPVEGPWIDPYPDEVFDEGDGTASPAARYERREALELAFIAALQHLPPRQRAALVLCDVLGFSAKDAAEALDTTVASVNGVLRRARARMAKRLPERSQQTALRAIGNRRLRGIVERFVDAFEQGEIDAVVAMLAKDVTFAMPPFPDWYRGREAVGKSWLIPDTPGTVRYIVTRANGQPALGAYALDPESGSYLPVALDILTLHGAEVAQVTAFRTPELFARFGLPGHFTARDVSKPM